MSDRERLNRWNEKEDFIDEIKSVVGREPAGIRQLLGILSHPDLLDHTLAFFKQYDTKHRCLIYEAPWNCAREAEAKYENIKFGWTGGAGGIGFDEHWCEPCRQRVMDND